MSPTCPVLRFGLPPRKVLWCVHVEEGRRIAELDLGGSKFLPDFAHGTPAFVEGAGDDGQGVVMHNCA